MWHPRLQPRNAGLWLQNLLFSLCVSFSTLSFSVLIAQLNKLGDHMRTCPNKWTCVMSVPTSSTAVFNSLSIFPPSIPSTSFCSFLVFYQFCFVCSASNCRRKTYNICFFRSGFHVPGTFSSIRFPAKDRILFCFVTESNSPVSVYHIDPFILWWALRLIP